MQNIKRRSRLMRKWHFRNEPKENLLAELKKYDTVIVIDDSVSMSWPVGPEPGSCSRWEQARKALQKLVKVVKFDTDGIDFYFLNSERKLLNCKSSWKIMRLFKKVEPKKGTPLGTKLEEIIDEYMIAYRKDQSIKPMNIIVVTDGQPDSKRKVFDVITKTAEELNERQVDTRQVGIQFVQIANEPDATEFLRSLDDDLKKQLGDRDMVDTIKSVPGEEFDLVKALTGAMNPKQDNRKANSGTSGMAGDNLGAK